jgi:hypothetical protein
MANIPHYIRGEEIEREFFKALEPFERKLTNDGQTDRATWYEVRVEGLKVIGKTNDPSEFSNLLDYIDLQRTKEFEIRIYQGASTHHDRHLFYFERGNPRKKEEITLAGLEGRIQQGVAEARKQWEQEQLRAEHLKLKEDYKSLEEYADKIEEELEKFRAKKLHLGNIDLVEVGGIFLEGFIRRNPNILTKLPGGEALAGAIIQDNEERSGQQQLPESQGQVMLSRAESEESEQDKHYMDLLRQIQASFTQEDFLGAMTVLDLLMKRPDLISMVEALLKRETCRTKSEEKNDSY